MRDGYGAALAQALKDPSKEQWYGKAPDGSGGGGFAATVTASAPSAGSEAGAGAKAKPSAPRGRGRTREPTPPADGADAQADAGAGADAPLSGPMVVGANTGAGLDRGRRAATPAPLTGPIMRGEAPVPRRAASATPAGSVAVGARRGGGRSGGEKDSKPSLLLRVLNVFGLGDKSARRGDDDGVDSGLAAARAAMVTRERARLHIAPDACVVAHTLLTVSELAMDLQYSDILSRFVDDLRTQHDNGWAIPTHAANTAHAEPSEGVAAANPHTQVHVHTHGSVPSPLPTVAQAAAAAQRSAPRPLTRAAGAGGKSGSNGSGSSSRNSGGAPGQGFTPPTRRTAFVDPLNPNNFTFQLDPTAVEADADDAHAAAGANPAAGPEGAAAAARAARTAAASPAATASAGMLVVPALLRPYLGTALGEWAHHSRNYTAVQAAAPFPAPPHWAAVATGPGVLAAATAAEAWGAARAMANVVVAGAGVERTLWRPCGHARPGEFARGDGGELIVHGYVRLPELQFTIDASKGGGASG
jgi:hypothetical protein